MLQSLAVSDWRTMGAVRLQTPPHRGCVAVPGMDVSLESAAALAYAITVQGHWRFLPFSVDEERNVQMREKDSVAVYFMHAMLHALRENPQRLRAVLEQAGIDPALMDQPTARVPASAFAALWLIQIRELNDEFFNLDSHGMPPGSFALICRALSLYSSESPERQRSKFPFHRITIPGLTPKTFPGKLFFRPMVTNGVRG